MVPDAGEAVKSIVLIDTNGLMAPFQMGFNLDAQLESLIGPCRVVAIPSVMRELRGLSGENRHARLALSLVRSKGYDDLSGLPLPLIRAIDDTSSLVADEALLRIASDYSELFVFTNDRELRDRLRDAGTRVIIVRGGNHLEFYRR